MVASIGAVASPSQGAHYYERDGYYAKDSPEHRAASAWRGRGAAELGLDGPVDPDTFGKVLAGEVPDGSGQRLGRRIGGGKIHHRPGRDLTFSAPKSVSLAALVGGDDRIVKAHDRAVGRSLEWFEKNAAETRVHDAASGTMVRTRGQRAVIATFRHETSRNLDPALHTHSVIANMLRGPDGKWRTMANERLYASKMLLGAMYRSELAAELKQLGYGIERTHADGRFEIAGVSRETIEAFSTRRAEIEAAMRERGLGTTAENPHLAQRAALMTRAHKRDVDRDALRESWVQRAAEIGFDAKEVAASAVERTPGSRERQRGDPGKGAREGPAEPGHQMELFESPAPAAARKAVDWAVSHLSERDAVFGSNDLLAAALAFDPGAASIGAVERAVAGLKREGRLHEAKALGAGLLTTDRAVADERETVSLMRTGQRRGKAPMRGWVVDRYLRKGPLTDGQRQAVKLILSEKDRTVGVQGLAGTGKTTMLNRARTLADKNRWRMVGLAPSASAARTLAAESGIESETLQRFLARNTGVAAGRLTKKGQKTMRAQYRKTALVVDEGSLASTVQARNLLRIARELRIPKVVLVGDSKQLDAVDAGKPFAQLQAAGMKTALMDRIMRQKNPELKEAVEASIEGEIGKAFEKLGSNVAEVIPDNIAGAVAARWLKLSPEERERTGVMTPSHRLRRAVNDHIRERLTREGRITGPRPSNTAAGLQGLHPRGEGARLQLRGGRRGGVSPSVQASGCGERRRTARGTSRSREEDRAPGRPGRLDRGLEAVGNRRPPRRDRSLPVRKHRASRRGPHPLDPQRQVSGRGQQRHGRGSGRSQRAGDVPARGGRDAHANPGRSATAASGPGVVLDRARFPGQNRGQRDRGDGGEPPEADHPEIFLR